MPRYDVTINVEALTGAAWDEWCERGPVDGIEYAALQSDGVEHWTVTAPNAALARDLAERAIGDDHAEIVGVALKKFPGRNIAERERNTARVSLRLDPATVEDLREHAEQSGRTMAEIAEIAFTEYLRRHHRE